MLNPNDDGGTPNKARQTRGRRAHDPPGPRLAPISHEPAATAIRTTNIRRRSLQSTREDCQSESRAPKREVLQLRSHTRCMSLARQQAMGFPLRQTRAMPSSLLVNTFRPRSLASRGPDANESALKTQYIFRWDGEPIGFIHSDALYNFRCAFLGWIEPDGSVWAAETGQYLGLLVDRAYIRRSSLRVPPSTRLRPYIPPPFPPAPVQVPQRRGPRPPDATWMDGL